MNFEDSAFVHNCYHEAAHAVAAHVSGLIVRSVHASGGEEGSYVEFDATDEERTAIVYAAGGAGAAEYERRARDFALLASVHGHTPAWRRPIPAGQSEEDRKEINRYLAENWYSGVEAQMERARLAVEARSLVLQNWPAVKRVVDALVAAMQFDAAEVPYARLSRSEFLKVVS